jgi:hypothetical protein
MALVSCGHRRLERIQSSDSTGWAACAAIGVGGDGFPFPPTANGAIVMLGGL